MAKSIPEASLHAIEEAAARHPEGASLGQIMALLAEPAPRRTVQHRLKLLVDAQRIVMRGAGRWARYVPSDAAPPAATEDFPLSPQGAEIRDLIHRPLTQRQPAGYDRSFLDGYSPNRSFYLAEAERARLRNIGTPRISEQPAGTYARHILNRLLIDLSWNSSRLEGNTYSLLDTKRLIDLGQQAEGKGGVETQMILNHKDAIEFLVDGAGEIGFNRYTVLNLHALLANNLLPDPTAPGRLRRIAVGITESVFQPLEIPAQIVEYFDQILATATAITDPFEQAFFIMAQIPYLQPFDDVNKRVSRLAANIPFIKGNLTPLSFDGVPRGLYTEAMLAIYELRRVDLLRDLFLWAYERSAARYTAVRQSLGEPDPFRLRYRDALRGWISQVVSSNMRRNQAFQHVRDWAEQYVEPADRGHFEEVAIDELLALHEGNFARYRITPAAFAAWQAVWADNRPG